MLSFRLTKDMENKINIFSQKKKVSKSQIIKEALQKYIIDNENDNTSYELGKNLFGKYGSGDGNLSVDYKGKIKQTINEKNSD